MLFYSLFLLYTLLVFLSINIDKWRKTSYTEKNTKGLNGMLKNRKLQHIGFPVNDIEKTTDWYVNVLGFEVVNEATTPDGKVPIKFIKNGNTLTISCNS